jgi:uncharacterized protein YqjF (DUF2071 family)
MLIKRVGGKGERRKVTEVDAVSNGECWLGVLPFRLPFTSARPYYRCIPSLVQVPAAE